MDPCRGQNDQEIDLSRRNSVYLVGAAVGLLLLGGPLAFAQSAAGTQDALLKNGPPVWDANHDGVYTCAE